MKYSDVVKSGLILPKKSKYTVKDADSVMQNSLFKPYKGRTFTPDEAAFIVKASAIHHGTDYSDALNTYGENAIRKNPAPKRKTAARTQRAAEAYVRRPSQITKKAPSKRLKKRRTINLQSPRGVFPNPKTRSSLEKTSSWVIRNKKTGEVIMETFDIKKVNALNTAKYEAVPILKYLQELNSGIKKNPSSVHFDIDVNSHNARGAKAKTRVNPVARKKIAGLKNFIVQESAFSDTTGFKTVAVFAKVDESFEYAKARDAKNRSEGKRRWIKVLEG